MIHHVYANRSNIGDWLSARAIQSLLPPLPLREHLCDEYFVADTLAALANVGRGDTIVIGGGGLFMDYFLPFWAGMRDLVGRTSVVIWGVGYCDSKERISHPPAELMREVVRQSRLCVVRDELTRNHLDIPNLPPPVPCPSLLKIEPPPEKKRILLHAVHYEATGHERYEQLCDLARHFAARTGRQYLETNNEIEHDSEKEFTANLRDYRNADLVLTSRLHGCIIGAGMGCRVVAISGDHKLEAFMRVAGLADWVCDMNAMHRLDDLLSRAAAGEQPSCSEFIEDVRQRNRAVGEQVAAIINQSRGSRT